MVAGCRGSGFRVEDLGLRVWVFSGFTDNCTKELPVQAWTVIFDLLV